MALLTNNEQIRRTCGLISEHATPRSSHGICHDGPADEAPCFNCSGKEGETGECAALETKWKSEINSMKKTGRMTVEEVDSKIESLEFKHAHSSHSNTEEQAFMRDIALLKQNKKDIIANREKQLLLDELKKEKG